MCTRLKVLTAVLLRIHIFWTVTVSLCEWFSVC